ncbi:right-handed parallel beta-helix repeat-containing protein, partial [Hydrogenobacter thermophilus]|uniref:right-handed parallel beta-helix repeat-containing protein n=1 Tax=Hydrogenobacter thermophilus TaxID=940 RepID=UPI0030FAFA23
MLRRRLLPLALAVLAYSCGGGSGDPGSTISPKALKPMQTCDFTVNTTNDTVDVSPGDGTCADSSNNCSLRAAIMEANAQGGTKVICLGTNQTYTLSRDTAAGDDDTAAEDDLDIVAGADITIEGNGSTVQRDPSLTCNLDYTSAVGEFRIFHVLSGGSLTLKDLTVRNGCADGILPPYASGGGILNYGTLTIEGIAILNNFATDGGGIYNYGMVTIQNSTISDNNADPFFGSGGGIYNNSSSTLNIQSSNISNNTSRYGGGVYNDSNSTVTIQSSTISSNSAGNNGGGILNYYGTVTITNSTISGNNANLSSGGGIYNNSGTLTITNSTISGNSADGDGGGIDNSGTLTITNSTISDNTAGHGGGIANGGTLDITNSTISNNSAGFDGGGIENWTGTVNASFVTIANNTANNQGGGIYNLDTFNIKNSIVANNTVGGSPQNCTI